MMRSAPVQGQDAAFAAWDSEDYPMHIAALLHFAEGAWTSEIDAASLARELAPRIECEEQLHRTLRPRRGRHPRWQWETRLDLERHVHETGWRLAAGRRLGLLDELMSRPLDPSRPPWEIWLIHGDRRRGGFSLLVKIHHALVDGRGGMDMLERLFASSPVPAGGQAGSRVARPPSTRRARWLRGALRLVAGVFERRVASLFETLRPEPLQRESLTLPTESLLRAAREAGATPHEMLLALVGGGLRRWQIGEVGAARRSLRAFVPVDLRADTRGTGTLNRISFWLVDLATDVIDARERLRRIRRATRSARRDRAHALGSWVAHCVSWLGPQVARLGLRALTSLRAFDVVATTVPAPGTELRVFGQEGIGIEAHAPLFPGQRVAITTVVGRDEVRIGVSQTLGAPGRRLIDSLRREGEALFAEAGDDRFDRVA